MGSVEFGSLFIVLGAFALLGILLRLSERPARPIAPFKGESEHHFRSRQVSWDFINNDR